MAVWTVNNGTNISNDYADLNRSPLLALEIPAGYNGGNITFKAASTPGGTFNDVYDTSGTLITITVGGASRVVAVTGTALQALASLSFVKLATVSNVTGAQTINIIATPQR